MSNIYDELLQKSELWKHMVRSNEEQRTAAEEYYKTDLMPIIIDHFLQETTVQEECDAMVLTLGTSYEPLVLSICALKPKRVLILYTNKSFHLLDDVIEFTKLKPTQYTSSDVDAENQLKLN